MAKPILETSEVKIDQKPVIFETRNPKGEIIRCEVSELGKTEYLDLLAMGEDPITIVVEPSNEENPPHSYHCEVNGKGAECLGPDGNWWPVPWVPVGQQLIMKRKYVEVLVRAKKDKVKTEYGKVGEENPQNKIVRTTSAVANVQIYHDPNPKGPAYFAELRRRNL